MLGDLSAFLNFLRCFLLHRVPCLIPPKVHEVSRSETHEFLTAKAIEDTYGTNLELRR